MQLSTFASFHFSNGVRFSNRLNETLPKIISYDISRFQRVNSPFCDKSHIIVDILYIEIIDVIFWHIDRDKLGSFYGGIINRVFDFSSVFAQRFCSFDVIDFDGISNEFIRFRKPNFY